MPDKTGADAGRTYSMKEGDMVIPGYAVKLFWVAQAFIGIVVGWGSSKLDAIEDTQKKTNEAVAVLTAQVARNDATEKQMNQNRADIAELRALVNRVLVERTQVQ